MSLKTDNKPEDTVVNSEAEESEVEEGHEESNEEGLLDEVPDDIDVCFFRYNYY